VTVILVYSRLFAVFFQAASLFVCSGVPQGYRTNVFRPALGSNEKFGAGVRVCGRRIDEEFWIFGQFWAELAVGRIPGRAGCRARSSFSLVWERSGTRRPDAFCPGTWLLCILIVGPVFCSF